jgi:hypothetical protein
VLTWFAVASFASAAATALRWYGRRRDALGRRRPFPAISTAVLVVAGLLALVPVVRHARLEGQLSRIASRLVGVPVRVHCQTVGEAMVATDQHLGFVPWGPDGRPEPRTTIMREPCDALAGYRSSGHRQPSEVEVQAVHVLSHESRHMAGVMDEARAECQAMQRDAEAARLLGADATQARRLARYYWLVDYPRMPEGYRSSECTAGGSWDEHLPDAPWAAPGSA